MFPLVQLLPTIDKGAPGKYVAIPEIVQSLINARATALPGFIPAGAEGQRVKEGAGEDVGVVDGPGAFSSAALNGFRGFPAGCPVPC